MAEQVFNLHFLIPFRPLSHRTCVVCIH